MTYRDDREALRSQVESLQQELEQARSEQEHLAGIEQRLEAAKREMQAAEAELARARGRLRARSPRTAGLIAVLTVLGLGGVLATMTLRRSSPSTVRVAHVPPSLPNPPRTAVAPPVDVAPPVPPPPPASTHPAGHTAHATWAASVTSARGVPLARGARCTIEADIVPDAKSMHAKNVEVHCGATKLYSDRDPLSGMAMVDSDAKQRAGAKPGTWQYDLVFRDRGSRARSRNQAQLDSTLKIGRVWSDELPELRVDLAITAGSAPVDVAVVVD